MRKQGCLILWLSCVALITTSLFIIDKCIFVVNGKDSFCPSSGLGGDHKRMLEIFGFYLPFMPKLKFIVDLPEVLLQI